MTLNQLNGMKSIEELYNNDTKSPHYTPNPYQSRNLHEIKRDSVISKSTENLSLKKLDPGSYYNINSYLKNKQSRN